MPEQDAQFEAFAASTREEMRHDRTMRLVRRSADWSREFEAWRCQQRLVRVGALRVLTAAQLWALAPQ